MTRASSWNAPSPGVVPAGAPPPLIADLVDGQLRVNAYWDDGCPLVPEGEDTFRLEATEHLITFVREPDGTVDGLHYVHDAKIDLYRRKF